MVIFLLIRLHQICPKWIKLDPKWISPQSKNVDIISCCIYHEYRNCHIIFDQIGSDLTVAMNELLCLKNAGA